MENIFVTKKSGEKEAFSQEKILASMARIGLSKDMRPQVLAHVRDRLHQDITTSEIFSHIVEFLDKNARSVSIKFNLKRAIFDLGPTGFPFERFLGRIFEAQGYKIETNIILQGECVDHEIDLLLEKDGKKIMVEAKFHNTAGVKTDIQTALYTYARFLDVGEKNQINSVWIATNTKLTDDAINYGRCKGIEMIAWSFPQDGNLQNLIEQTGMYPITILKDLSEEERERLLAADVVLCSDILSLNREDLERFSINKEHFLQILEDAKSICQQKI